MRANRYQVGIYQSLLSGCVLVCLLAGCAVVGPSAIRSGRLVYNKVITETNHQQMLMVVIQNRYEELSNLLAVASVTANVSVTSNAGINLGFGDADGYAGNLVPFSAGVIYEENPTISYTPVEGEKYMSQTMSPVPIASLAQLARALSSQTPVYTALISSVNGIYNPNFLFSPAETDPRFSRFVAIMTELTRAHRLHWVKDPQQDDSFSIVIDHYAPTYAAEVSELLRLLGLSAPESGSPQVILPVSLAVDGRDTGGIGITTRSVFDLLEILSAAIEIPEEDQRNGVTASFPPPGVVGRELRIGQAEYRPEHASVAVKYRNRWFYIDEKDHATKRFFILLSTLWSVTIAENSSKASAAPVLTVPVSR